MSYGVMAYLVPKGAFNKLTNSYRNSQKTSFLSFFQKSFDHYSVISEQNGERLDSLNDEVTNENPEITYPFADHVLKQFLFNEITNTDYDHVNGYVFEIICGYLGEQLDNSSWYPSSSASVYSIPFMDHKLPYKFTMYSEWPGISHVDYKSIKKEFFKLDEACEEQHEQLISWFERAITEKKDLYLFHY
ncbi:DUF7691 family protein [Vibrio campbellii]|uniref:DUF7691 family protein n=1 Tax=Vibrio campbellii TaxID=680 RepID=UPI00210955F2|nr:hypothetical protein [Vibrio campbellii]UTZ41502.1 hypothetical protein HB764_08925 [Vibrio campbellii]